MRARLNLSQRAVLTAGLGAALYYAGDSVADIIAPPATWGMYSPPSPAPTSFFVTVHFHPIGLLLLWLALAATWTAASLLILRGPRA